jgi:hypothetical protein
MPKIWLPISHGGRTRNILIPHTQDMDKSQLNEIVEWQKEKTLNELKKLPPKKPIEIAKAQEIGAQLNEYLQYLKRKKNDGIKKYY